MPQQINWYGNSGLCNFDPGTVEMVNCGVCGSPMNVERNVIGPTSFAEAMARRKHRHDGFICPHLKEGWHGRICDLKIEVYLAEINNAHDKEEIKKAAEEEILKLLEANAAR